MVTINIDGKEIQLTERQPLRPGAPVTVDGVLMEMPPPLYARQLNGMKFEAEYHAGQRTGQEMAEVELEGFVATLRRNYPDLPDAWIQQWDARDIWALRTAYIAAANPASEVAADSEVQVGEAVSG